jgi:hypothetical protein
MNLELPLDGSVRERLRAVSSGVFGAAGAFEVLLELALRDEVYSAGVAELTGAHESYTSTFLRRLERLELIELAPQSGGMRRKHYRRRDSPLWELVTAWARDIARSAASEEVRITRVAAQVAAPLDRGPV